MARGDVLFDVGFADDDFSVPMVMTLVDLDSTEVVGGDTKRVYLFVGSALEAHPEERSLVALTDSQVSDLMTAEQLANKIQGMRPFVSPKVLDDLGL
jgi:hypothetical protein